MADAKTRIITSARKGVSGAYTALEAYAHLFVSLRALSRLSLPDTIQSVIHQLLSYAADADTDSLLAFCPESLRQFRAFAEEELAAVVAMYAHAIKELEDEPPEESYCRFALMPIECAHCLETC